MSMPPERKRHIPEGGWVAQAYYIVDVAFNASNPIHRAILFTGFLNGEDRKTKEKDLPGGYACLMRGGGYETQGYDYGRAYWLKPVRLLLTQDELDVEEPAVLAAEDAAPSG